MQNKRKRNDEDDDDDDYGSSSTKTKTDSSRKKKSSGSVSGSFVKEEMDDCLVLLETMMKEEIAGPFNQPVDWKALNLMDYPKIIKNPMDLGSIKEMLLCNSLANTEHFAEHIRLVFNNALTFNTDESHVAQFAKKLLANFESDYIDMLDRWRKEVTENQNNQQNNQQEIDQEKEKEKQTLKKDLDTLQNQIDNTRQQINELKRKRGLLEKSAASSSLTKRVKLTRPKAPLTIKQKEELCQKIGELGEEDFPGLINLVDPDANEDTEFTLNFAVLDDTTILSIQKYVQDCAKAKKKKNGSQKKKFGFK